MHCGLCSSEAMSPYYQDLKRDWHYFICDQCQLVFRDPATYLVSTVEKQRYETHNNSIENEGYVRFLSPAVEVLLPYLQEGALGLDFGSGPGPILDTLFARQGFKVKNYDPYFAKDKSSLEANYDFITCTEVFEHLYTPKNEMSLITEILKKQGYLVLMSEFRKDDVAHFARWGYRMDSTHVCFLNQTSMDWLCRQWGYELLSCDGRLSLLRKKD